MVLPSLTCPQVSCQLCCAAGPVSLHGKGFAAEILPPLCSVNVPTQPTLALPPGFLGTKQGADGVGACRAADACTQVCDTSTCPSPVSSHPEIPPGCRNTPPACNQDCSHALRDTGTSPSPPPAPAFLTGKAGCVKSVLGASADTSSSPKPMRNAQTGSAGLHTNGVRARREQGREREGARLQLLATHD